MLRANDVAVALEHEPGDLLEAPVVEVLNDLHDRLLALADGDEVELIDKRVRLARGIRTADDSKRLVAHLLGQGERLVLHGDHAVDADHGRLQPFDFRQDLATLQERVVDVTHAVARAAQRRAQVHQPEGRHDPVPPLGRGALRIHQDDVGSVQLSHLAS